MRSRYSAYVLEEIDYIVETHNPETRDEEVDRDATAQWAATSNWKGLTIVGTEKGGPDDKEGMVEFIARYETDGSTISHHERSYFARIDDRWYFTDSENPGPRRVNKVGRNEPCPCGSGKKYKKCCGR